VLNSNLDALIAKLDTQGDIAAEKIIAQLIIIGKAAVPALIQAAKDQSAPRIRKWSLQALGSIGDRRAAPVLMNALTDDRMTVKLHALKGLGRMKYKKSVKKITELLADKSGGIRVNALLTLMAIGDRSVLPQIQKCLSDPQWYVRQNACVACGLFGDQNSKAKLKKISLADERKAVREAAAMALTEI
jgi:HEAT repeat protein